MYLSNKHKQVVNAIMVASWKISFRFGLSVSLAQGSCKAID